MFRLRELVWDMSKVWELIRRHPERGEGSTIVIDFGPVVPPLPLSKSKGQFHATPLSVLWEKLSLPNQSQTNPHPPLRFDLVPKPPLPSLALHLGGQQRFSAPLLEPKPLPQWGFDPTASPVPRHPSSPYRRLLAPVRGVNLRSLLTCSSSPSVQRVVLVIFPLPLGFLVPSCHLSLPSFRASFPSSPSLWVTPSLGGLTSPHVFPVRFTSFSALPSFTSVRSAYIRASFLPLPLLLSTSFPVAEWTLPSAVPAFRCSLLTSTSCSASVVQEL
ncbi:hypothetical protein P692DRAFT_201866900 [Suillus brevipes Sb2]|nr:hypothetical protein P692DRAFT_201866900 [Suillus brevipes Sb2]